MAFNDAMLRILLKKLPQSWTDGVPDLIVKAVNERIRATKVEEGEAAAVMIFPGEGDCRISIVAIDEADNIRFVENYSGQQFIKTLLKSTDNG